jgi:hypothetical protein
MKTTSPRIAALALAATMALGACSQQQRYATEDFSPVGVIAVEVSNNNWMDMVVYAVSSGSRVRLGSVTTGFQQRFKLPPSANAQSGPLYLEAHPVGSHEIYRSDPIMVTPGTKVVWSLENQLGLSSHRIASGK